MEPNRSPRRPAGVRLVAVLALVLASLALVPSGVAAGCAADCSIWNVLVDAPANPTALSDGQPIELGTKFRSQVAGEITALRFYKGVGDTGGHIGHLWTADGQLLATAAFDNQTASGWQQAELASPVAISAATTYVVSYYSPSTNFVISAGYFTSGLDSPPLRALQAGEDGPNGVYVYNPDPGVDFPNGGNTANYWADVIFQPSESDTTPPAVTTVAPTAGASGVATGASVAAVFSEPLDPATVDGTTVELRAGAGPPVGAIVSYTAASQTILLDPSAPLAESTTYTATVRGGAADPRVKDVAGNPLAADVSWSFTTGASGPPPTEGPGGPILVVGSPGSPFSLYYAEILRAEGLNEFAVADVSTLSAGLLAGYDAVVLGDVPVTAAQAALLGDWVTAGGNLVAMRPDAELADLLGLAGPASTLSDAYLRVDAGSGPGTGIVAESMQYHGTADAWSLAGAQALATLYSSASTATSSPAVTLRPVGTAGGQAAAFTYDLARSVVLTRQGDPSRSGQELDGEPPIRSDDLFHPDWVDFSKIAIPQADEQQRLLANLLTAMTLDRTPLPRFWYFPRGERAVLVMTGDDHGNGGTVGRLAAYAAASAPGCSVDNWECIRSTSYVYPSTPIGAQQAAAFAADGFELALHVTTDCQDWTPASLEANYRGQLADFATAFPLVQPPATSRTHCIPWSDYDTQPQIELAHGIRLDTNYYYWPAAWVGDRPGLFTGSGLPMRFATANGTLVDVYQAATQMTDESGQSYPATANALLDRALGPEGYYGAFVANMHTDSAAHAGSDAIVASATARGVPIVSARQLLTWLDGRNGSSFGAIAWNGSTLSFTVSVGVGANGLRGMVPVESASGELTGLTRDGSPVTYDTETVKGVRYATFSATAGSYEAAYAADETPPVVSAVVASPADDSAVVTWATDEPASSRVDYGTAPGALDETASETPLVSSHSVELTGLVPGTTYYFRVVSEDSGGFATTFPAPPDPPLEFSTPAAGIVDTTVADFGAGSLGAGAAVGQAADGEVLLAPLEGQEFTSVPAGWSAFAWPGETPAALQVAGGSLTVDGMRAGTDATYGPGRSLEFVATFGATSGQHAGFGDTFNAPAWMIFSTFNTAETLYARTHDGTTGLDTPIPGSWLGSAHRYRIEWDAGEVRYLIDGNLVATHPLAVASSLRPLASDLTAGGPAISIDWLRLSPYAGSATFTSRVLDAGEVVDWTALRWTAELPAGTALAVSVRTGPTSTPDASWSAFAPVSASGDDVAGSSRYLQYRVELSTSAAGSTPILESVRAEHGPAAPVPDAPGLTGTVPVSPANDNDPAVTGSAPAGSTVDLYATPDCTGALLASGTAADLAGTGIAIAVGDDTTTTVHATATAGGQTSGCSTASVTYVEDSTAPDPPALTATNPVSPADGNQPLILGTAEPASTVRLYGTSTCTAPPLATGTATGLAAPGLRIDVPDDSTTTVYATAEDAAGNVSACSPAGITYTEVSTAPDPCAGSPPVGAIVGTPGNDVLNGTRRADVIFGLGGNDRINGRQGGDLICGGEGNDGLDGSSGDDRLDGGTGNDILTAGTGNDVLTGGEDLDLLNGGSGSDNLDGGPGLDVLVGARGFDTCVGEVRITCEA